MITDFTKPTFIKLLNQQKLGEWKIDVYPTKNQVWFRFISDTEAFKLMFNRDELSLAWDEREVVMIVMRRLAMGITTPENLVLDDLLNK